MTQGKDLLEGHLGCFVTAHDTFPQYVGFFFDQFESGLACECSDQLYIMKMMPCQFQVKSPLKSPEGFF